MLKGSTNPLIWIVPAALCGLAVAPLPYAFYPLLRLVTCGAAGYLCWAEWAKASKWTGWAIALVVGAAIFNPVLPLRLSRGAWAPVDVAMAGLFVAHLLATRRRRSAPDVA